MGLDLKHYPEFLRKRLAPFGLLSACFVMFLTGTITQFEKKISELDLDHSTRTIFLWLLADESKVIGKENVGDVTMKLGVPLSAATLFS